MPVQMTAERLRDPIEFQKLRADNVPDALGHVDQRDLSKWYAFAKRFACVLATGAREVVVGDQTRMLRTWRIWVRRDDDTRRITSQLRVVIVEEDRAVANIEAAFDPNGDRRWMQIECIEAVEV